MKMRRMMELTGTHTVEDMQRAVSTVAGSRRLRLIAGLTTGQAYDLYNEDPENYIKNLEAIAMKKMEQFSGVVQAIAVEMSVSLDTAQQWIENGDAIDLGQLGSIRDFGREVWDEGLDGFDLTIEQRQALEEVIDFEEVAERVAKHNIVIQYGKYGGCWVIVW
jgi:hypothetical protein